MSVYSTKVVLSKTGELDILNVTDIVRLEVDRSGIKEGIVNVFVIGSTAGVTTMEYEPGLVIDMKAALERIAPRNAEYEHHKMWHDDNGHSHIRASLLGPSITLPLNKGRMALGTWQQIVFIELDNKPRTREIIITVNGE